jgi:TPR repeat protein
MYHLGRGAPKDNVIAYKWLSLATARGAKNAEDMRNTVAAEMTPAQIAKAQTLAREWKPKPER